MRKLINRPNSVPVEGPSKSLIKVVNEDQGTLSERQRKGIKFLKDWYSQPEAFKRAEALLGSDYQKYFDNATLDVSKMHDATKDEKMAKHFKKYNLYGEYNEDTGSTYVGLPNSDIGASTVVHEGMHQLKTDSMFDDRLPEVDKRARHVPLDLFRYLTDGSEIYPRVQELRFRHDLKNDGRLITPEDVKRMREINKQDSNNDYKKDEKLKPEEFQSNELFDLYDDDKLSEILNKLVSNKKQSNVTYARDGVKLVKPPKKADNVYDYINRAKQFMYQYFPDNPTYTVNTSVNNNTGIPIESRTLTQKHKNKFDTKPGKFDSLVAHKQGDDMSYSCQTLACMMHNKAFTSPIKNTAYTTSFMNSLEGSNQFHKQVFRDPVYTSAQAVPKLKLLSKPNSYHYLYSTEKQNGKGNHVRVAFSDNDSLYVVQDGDQNLPVRKNAVSLKDMNNFINNFNGQSLMPDKNRAGGLNYLLTTLNDKVIYTKK